MTKGILRMRSRASVFALAMVYFVLRLHRSFAQDSVTHLYAGGRLNIAGSGFIVNALTTLGFGIEGGIQFRDYYARVEIGLYGIDFLPNVITAQSSENLPKLTGVGFYYGAHAGILLSQKIWAEAVLLLSTASYRDVNYQEYLRTWFNIGPDLRFRGSEAMTINLA